MNIFNFIAWTILGIIHIFVLDDINKISYFAVWGMLMLMLAEKCFA